MSPKTISAATAAETKLFNLELLGVGCNAETPKPQNEALGRMLVFEPSEFKKSIRIDAEFDAMLGGLSENEEKAMDGLFDKGRAQIVPGVVWSDPDHPGIWTLLAGHNRFRKCEVRKLAFKAVVVPDFIKNRDDALDFIAEEQLGRRNVTGAAEAYLLNREYRKIVKNRAKNLPNAPKPQNEALGKTIDKSERKNTSKPQKSAAILAGKYDTPLSTMERKLKKGREIADIERAHGAGARDAIIKGEKKVEDFKPPKSGPSRVIGESVNFAILSPLNNAVRFIKDAETAYKGVMHEPDKRRDKKTARALDELGTAIDSFNRQVPR